MEKTKPAAPGRGHLAGKSELLQLNRTTKSEYCPKFSKCCAPICPIDTNWKLRTHLRDEPVCFYLREYVKVGLRLKLRGVLTTQTYHRLTSAYHGIVSSFYDIKKQLKRSAKTGSRLGSLPGNNTKAAA